LADLNNFLAHRNMHGEIDCNLLHIVNLFGVSDVLR